MQGLLRKLAGLDSDAERGVRVIEFFDQLVIHGADFEAIARASAVLAEGTAGIVDDRTGTTCAVGVDGLPVAGGAPSKTAVLREVRVEGRPVGLVWIERVEGPREWDELIADRMALTVAATRKETAQRLEHTDLELSDPAVVQRLLDAKVTEVERSRAVRLLGFAAGQSVDVVAVKAAEGMHGALARIRKDVLEESGHHAVGAALSDTLGVLIVGAHNVAAIEGADDIYGCIAERVVIETVAGVWPSVRQGVRFTSVGGPWPKMIRLTELGSLILLADLPPEAVLSNGDVRCIKEIAARQGGDLDLRLLRATCTSTSLREAAQESHMHHSSASYRLTRLSSELGFDVRSGANRYRLMTGLLLWALHRDETAG